ncbi:MAG TPA: hypothetical protein VGM56_06405 [Byssovorax sp.]|jgi:hypothetical protein
MPSASAGDERARASTGAPFGPTARLLTRTAGVAGALRALPSLAGLAVASSIVFGGNGMRTADVVHALHDSRGAAIAVWGAWLVLTAPAARALLEAREAFFLRALPVPPWHGALVHALHLLALELPWMTLFLLGGGPVAAASAGLLAAGASALAVARPRSKREIAAAAAVAVALLAPLPYAAGVAIGACATAIGVSFAWARAPGRGARRGPSRVSGGPLRALASAHAAVLARRDGVTLARGVLAAVVGGAVFALLVRNNGADARGHEVELAAFAFALPLSVAASGVASRAVETEITLEWLLLATGASARLRAVAVAAAPVAWALALGAATGLAGALSAGLGARTALVVAASTAALGASLGGAAAYFARAGETASAVDGTRVVVGMILSSVAVFASVGALGPRALAPLVAASGVLVAASVPLLARRDRVVSCVAPSARALSASARGGGA